MTTSAAWLPIRGGPLDGGECYRSDDWEPGHWLWLVPRETVHRSTGWEAAGPEPTHCYRVGADGASVEWVKIPARGRQA
jgi:hypothetical protein